MTVTFFSVKDELILFPDKIKVKQVQRGLNSEQAKWLQATEGEGGGV